MNEPWNPHLNSTSTSSPIYRTIVVPNIIPPGTVASRVQYLQGLSNPSSARPLQSRTRRREHSRTTFGRRLTTRFGRPALQSTKPDEESHVETTHSFRGLRTPRTKHTEEHANSKFQLTQSPKLRGESKRQGIVQRTDAAIPWAGLSRSKASRSMGRKGASADSETLNEGMCSSNRRKFASKMSIFPNPEDQHDRDYGPTDIRAGLENSESTIATTSTLRRKSVRDLFEHYGIERPDGLASSRETSQDAEPLPIRRHKCCHLCSRINNGMSVDCWRCGHKLCSKCNKLSPLPITQRSFDFIEDLSKQKISSPVLTPPPEAKSSTRPWPTPLQPDGTVRKRSSTTKFPAYVEQLVQLRKTPPPDNAVVAPVLISPVWGARKRRSVKDSPFLIADLVYPNRPPRSLASDAGNGRMAEVTLAEDPVFIAAPCSSTRVILQKGCHSPRPQSQDMPTSRLLSQPSQCLKRRTSAGPCGKFLPEYVECHGYPRTGHSRYGSPVSSGIVGECQHCLDDCQCASCQSTHHNVRCCLHADHQSIVHHHHQIQQKAQLPKAISEESARLSLGEKRLDLEPEIAPIMPQIENSLGQESDYSQVSPNEVSRSLTATPKAGRENLTCPMSADAHVSSSDESLCLKPSLQNIPLPRSKAFIFKKLRPTPPPWVENPRDATSSGDPRKQDPSSERNGAETAFKVKDRPASVTIPSMRSCEPPSVPQPATLSSRSSTSRQSTRKTSRRLSAIFQLKAMSPVPLLNQKLKEHQEDLKREDREVKAGIARGSVERRVTAIELEKEADENYTSRVDRPASQDSKSEKKKWRLKLVDKRPNPNCCEEDGYKFAEEHRLSDDEMITEMDGSKSKRGTWIQPPPSNPNLYQDSGTDHLIEKDANNKFGDSEIKCVTVIFHFEGREDMVLKAESWTGGQMINKS